MKYVKIFLIIVALLNSYSIYNQDTLLPEIITHAENTFPAESDIKTKVEEPTHIQKWNDHLELLKTDADYWDTATNNPISYWRNTAFELAEKIINENSSMADMLKTSFVDALNAKTTKFNDISDLIDEFKEFIKEKIAAKEKQVEQSKEIEPIPAPIISEPITNPEPIIEPVSVPVETPSSSPETAPTSQITETTQPKNLKDDWQTVLKSIEEDENGVAAIDKAHELTTKLLLSGRIDPQDLEYEFNRALTNRMRKKKLNPNIVDKERSYFKMRIAEHMQPIESKVGAYPVHSATSPLNKEQQNERLARRALEEEYAQKDAQAREELEKKRQKEEDRMKILAAAQKAEEENIITKEQLRQAHYSAQLQKEREAEIERAHKAEIQKMKNAQEAISQNIQQMAQAQKAESEKGMFSAFTQAVGSWWYGQESQKSTELSAKKQEELINTMVQGTKDPEAAKKYFNISNIFYSILI